MKPQVVWWQRPRCCSAHGVPARPASALAELGRHSAPRRHDERDAAAGQRAVGSLCQLPERPCVGPAAAAVAGRRCFAGKSSRKIPTPTTQVRTSSTNPGVDQGEDSTKKASTHPAASGNLERKPTQDTRRTEPHARTSTSKRRMCTYGTVRSLISAKQHPGTLNTNTTL